jgi:formamidopyrimidine-DNA glycosylase
MPEWPEMEHYRRRLGDLVCDLNIAEAILNNPRPVNVTADEFDRALRGRRILFVERRGKFLLFHLDDGYRLVLHLPPGGYLRYGAKGDKPDGRFAAIIGFTDGNRLFFSIPAQGYLHHLPAKTAAESLRSLGPEPFDPRLGEDAFAEALAAGQGSLKVVLTNQRVIAGIGSRYSDEICHQAGISPLARAADVPPEARRSLLKSMRLVLEEAVEAGGCMEKPLHVGDTLTGGYAKHLRVHNREGQACPRCGETIRRETVSSRHVYFCPSCQSFE